MFKFYNSKGEEGKGYTAEEWSNIIKEEGEARKVEKEDDSDEEDITDVLVEVSASLKEVVTTLSELSRQFTLIRESLPVTTTRTTE